MKDRCWFCKKWEEHFYWDHFEESSFRFLKVMNGDFTQKMELPPKFAKNFRVELIDVVALEAPSGKLWEIGLCKEEDHFYFNGGWEKFVEENEVEEYYILIFEYAGDSMFRVQIYDKTGCARAASNLIDTARAKLKNENPNWRKFPNSHSSRIDCNDHPMLHEQPTDNSSDSSKGFIKDEEHGMGKVKDDQTGEGKPKEMKDGCWFCKIWEEHFYWDHFEESNFRFVKVMNGDFTQKMELPPKVAKNFRVELIDVVALEAPSGKLWKIGLCKEEDHFYFNGGWEKFIEENEVEEYYILIFEYAGDSMFRVQIYDKTGRVRAASNLIDTARAKLKNVDQNWRNFHNSHYSRIDCNDHPMLHEQPTDNSSDSSKGFIKDEEHGMGKVKDDGRIRYSRNVKKEVAKLQPEAKLSLISLKYKLTILERKFACKQGNCSFVKLVKRSIGATTFLSIPLAFASKHFPQKPNGITVYNQSNKKWYVKCRWRRRSWGFSGKSLFTLSQENKIQNGDACVFELKKKSKVVELQMRIVRAKEVLSILKKECF